MLLFAGDPHGSYDHLYPFVRETDNLALIILGDLQLTSPDELDKLAQYCDIWFIHGNHDSKTIANFETIWGSHWASRNLHNRVEEIQGWRIAGLGGVFRGQIWMPPNRPRFVDQIQYCQHQSAEKIWRGGVSLRHRSSIFPAEIANLQTQEADILITHEAPKPHPMGFAVLNQLAEKMGVQHIFHGHHHDNHSYDQTRRYKITNVGFRSLADIDGHYLLKNIDDRHLQK